MRSPHHPRGPRRAAPDGRPLGTQESDPRILSPGSLSGDRPGTRPEPPPTSRRVAPPLLPGPGFLPHGARARRPPGSRLARSLLARCQVPAPPRATAHARPRSFSTPPSPPVPPDSDPGEPRPDASARIARATALPALSSQTRAVIGSTRSPPRSSPTLAEGSLAGARCPYTLLFPPISPPLRTRLGTDWASSNEGARLSGD